MVDLFKKEIFTAPKTTGAITEYSKSTIGAMLKHIDRNTTKTVVEFGPGRGNITQAILEHLPDDGELICYEINKADFEQYLEKIQDPRLTIHYLSCEHIDEHCQAGSVDIIISTIPLSLMNSDTVHQIIQKSYHTLHDTGKFITGQYSPYAKSFLSSYFPHLHQRRHIRNLPPVCILTATK